LISFNPQKQFIQRVDATPFPRLDVLPITCYNQHFEKLNGLANAITPFEECLSAKFKAAGHHVIPQFLVPDYDSLELKEAQNTNSPEFKRFIWAYDLAVIPSRANTNTTPIATSPSHTEQSLPPQADWQHMFLVEVDGKHHRRNPFQVKQDLRKKHVAHHVLHLPLVRVPNGDVAYMNIVETVVDKANRIREGWKN
jgi:hypothetical protein